MGVCIGHLPRMSDLGPPRPMLYRLAFVGTLSVLLVCCDGTGSVPGPVSSPAVFDQGEAWTYDVVVTQSPLDTSAVDTLGDVTARMEVADMNAEAGRRSGLVVLDVYRPAVPDSIDRTWYDQSPDSLVDVAYNRPGSVPWAQPLLRTGRSGEVPPGQLTRGMTGLPVLVRQRLSASGARTRTTSDSIQVRDDSRVVLQAPLQEGRSWVSFREPFRSQRFVGGQTTVEATAGTFEAVEVVTTLPETTPSLRWTDYYADEGLVRRVVTDTIEGRGPDGQRRGSVVQREAYDLISHED